MGILQSVRTVLGLASDLPDSAALQRALDEVGGRIARCREKIASLEQELPAAVIRSIDSGAAERRKLSQLQSELAGLETTRAAIERELAEALKAEADQELAARWAVSEQYGDEFIALAARANDAVDQLTDVCVEMLAKYEHFFRSLPVQAGDFSPRRFVEDFSGFITSRARCRSGDKLQLSRDLEHLAPAQLEGAGANDLAARAEEQVFIALRIKTSAAPDRSQTPQHTQTMEAVNA